MNHTITRRTFFAGCVVFAAGAAPRGQRPQPITSARLADASLIEDLVADYRIHAQLGVLDGFGRITSSRPTPLYFDYPLMLCGLIWGRTANFLHFRNSVSVPKFKPLRKV
jgi:hypothetical protein